MSSAKQKSAARRNVKKAVAAAKSKKTISHLSKATRTALGKQVQKSQKSAEAMADGLGGPRATLSGVGNGHVDLIVLTV
jgi:hypothetical protein